MAKCMHYTRSLGSVSAIERNAEAFMDRGEVENLYQSSHYCIFEVPFLSRLLLQECQVIGTHWARCRLQEQATLAAKTGQCNDTSWKCCSCEKQEDAASCARDDCIMQVSHLRLHNTFTSEPGGLPKYVRSRTRHSTPEGNAQSKRKTKREEWEKTSKTRVCRAQTFRLCVFFVVYLLQRAAEDFVTLSTKGGLFFL